MIALPPYAALLGLTRTADDRGVPVLTMPFADGVLGRPGFLHGGAIAGLLEIAAIAALRHALGTDDAGVIPLTITVDYRRGGRDAPTLATGIVTRLGTRIAHVDATAWQDDPARPIATARTNWRLDRPS
ncbi:PaaI family thioesterase [Sphingomonas sp. CFBP 8760]|uniref:PaaI family thioesterase n=1 Tax=Sphingomonas sp. CFBP 8760 TaxID=2775282 RepID=UPI001785C533|nr:PaaI family thioesterase [Sphingomonas sp. CFBP 8760]MBD8548878.1 PaaI family thioesterase [Sphingomonas sp. CFBP 8760]